jgi:hypothetical protein
MADLFDRVLSSTHDIAVHEFEAVLIDYMAGQTTRTQIINAYTLDAEATTQLDSLLNKISALTGKQDKVGFITEFGAIMMISESGRKYTTKSAFNSRLTQALNNWT